MDRIDLYPNRYVDKKKNGFLISFLYFLAPVLCLILAIVALFNNAFSSLNIWTMYFIFGVAWFVLSLSACLWVIVKQYKSYCFYKTMFESQGETLQGKIIEIKGPYINKTFGAKKYFVDIKIEGNDLAYIEFYRISDKSLFATGNTVEIITKMNIVTSVKVL